MVVPMVVPMMVPMVVPMVVLMVVLDWRLGGVNEVTPTGKSVSVSVRVVRAGESKLREFHPW